MTCATPDCHPGYSLVWLADVLRAAGLKVVEQPAWQTRGHGDVGQIQGVLCHDTVSAAGSNAPDLGIVTNGRPDLAGPLSQLLLARDGTFYVIAAGKCWHAGAGLWHGVSDGNAHLIGIEAENNGVDEPWPEIQLDAYARGCAAILVHVKAPVWMCAGHKEYCLPHGRKIDPDLDMTAFRARVGSHMAPQVGQAPLAPPRPAPAATPAQSPAPVVLTPPKPQKPPVRVPSVAKPPFSLWRWLASFFHHQPAPQGLLGVTNMNALPTVKSTNLLSNLNILSLLSAFGGLTALLPKILTEFSTAGIIAAGAMTIGILVQAFIPAGTAVAIENTLADSVIPAVGAFDPALKASLDQVAIGLHAAAAASAENTAATANNTAVVAAKAA